MASDRHALTTLLDEAGSLLGGVRLLEPVELVSDNTVVRARLESGRSVVVKKVTDSGFDQPGHAGLPQRFLNEWAGLEFLARVDARGFALSILAADAQSGVLVLEDLGELDNLESVLIEGTRGPALSGLSDFGTVLGQLHGLTRGHERRFLAVQDGLGTGSPMSDTTMDQREHRDVFEACCDAAGVELGDEMWRTVCEIEELVHGGSPFRALVHGDAGPHNVLLAPDGARLIDFEFCVYRNGLADVAGARLGFPQTAAAMAVPTDSAGRLETSYRRSLAEHVPEAHDDEAFLTSLGAACAHWTLNRLAASWRLHVEPRIATVDEMPDQEADRLARTMVMVDGFVSFAGDSGILEDLAEMVEAWARRWRALWPTIGTIPEYPTLRNGG